MSDGIYLQFNNECKIFVTAGKSGSGLPLPTLQWRKQVRLWGIFVAVSGNCGLPARMRQAGDVTQSLSGGSDTPSNVDTAGK